MWLVEWSGVNVIAQYMVIIFNKSGTNVEATTAPVYVALVRLAFALVSSAILRCSPRKPLLIISSATIAFRYDPSPNLEPSSIYNISIQSTASLPWARSSTFKTFCRRVAVKS